MESDQPVEEMMHFRKVMMTVQQAALASGQYFILWGCLNSAGMLYVWKSIRASVPLSPAIVWPLLTVTGWALTFILMRCERQSRRHSTLAGRALAMIWIGVGVAMSLVFFVGAATHSVSNASIPGLNAVFLGLGMLATGGLAGIRWLIGVAVLWGVSAVFLFFIHTDASLLVLTGCLLALFIGPGIVLSATARRASTPFTPLTSP